MLGFGLFWVGVSAWTRHQLLADGPTAMCVHAEHISKFRSGRWDTRSALERVALDRAHPSRRWRASAWQLRFATVSWFGFYS
jgi:hypothetical protein